MIKYNHPNVTMREAMLTPNHVSVGYVVSDTAEARRLAQCFSNVMRAAQCILPAMNICLAGERGVGKSLFSKHILLDHAGEITFKYRGKKGEFEAHSAKLGYIARLDSWAIPVVNQQAILAGVTLTRQGQNSILLIEHGQYLPHIPYDTVIALRKIDCDQRQVDIHMRPELTSTQNFQKFLKKTDALRVA